MVEQHFLQSEAWSRVQEALGRTVVSDQGDGWSYTAALEKGRLSTRLYSPYGPRVESADGLAQALDSLQKKGKELGATFIRVEPVGNISEDDLRAAGLTRAPRRQPEHTQRIDLSRPFSEVLSEMSASPRNLHRNYAKKGLTVRASSDPQDIEHLIRLLSDVSQRTGARMHEAEYLRTQSRVLLPRGDAHIYLVEKDDEVLAAALVFDDQTRRYYAHAAADSNARKYHPGSVLVSQMIEDACNGSQLEFDLYGVVPPDQTEHPWHGFSKFKRSFGGFQVDFLGTWELGLKPVSMTAYRILRRFLG